RNLRTADVKQKTEQTKSVSVIRRRVSGTDPRTADATRDPSSGLKPTINWIGISSNFAGPYRRITKCRRPQNQFQTFQWRPFVNTHTHFSETSTLHMKKDSNNDLPLRVMSPNLSSDKA
ncbi:hypothetical protein HAX54_038364, partial [Datura stramonium]|nr:hypothetical protein [Datura stramonium]